MKPLNLHPDDRAWMRRRLRTSGLGLAAILGVSAVLHYRARIDDPVSDLPPAVESVEASDSAGGRSIPPSGWRRTSRGWEHRSTWGVAETSGGNATLSELVLAQQAKEPAWLRLAFAQLRSIPPLAFALFQVIAIGVICQLGRRKTTP